MPGIANLRLRCSSVSTRNTIINKHGQGTVAWWIARLALETESVGSNPGHGKVFFSGLFSSSFFLPLSLTCTGIILDHKVTRFGRDKERKKINPSSAICEHHVEVWIGVTVGQNDVTDSLQSIGDSN